MTIGLVYAMEGEIQSLLNTSGARPLETVSGVRIFQIAPGILACAAGIGKVNAAMGVQCFIDRWHPDWIVNAGVAGSFQDLPIGTVVAVSEFVQHDVDTSAIGDPVGLVSTVNKTVFETDGLDRIQDILRGLDVPFLTGRAATGDVFMRPGPRADWVNAAFHPVLCDMEGGAIAQVCLRNGVRFSALKSVSDRLCAGDNAKEYFNFASAMEALNRVVLALAQRLGST